MAVVGRERISYGFPHGGVRSFAAVVMITKELSVLCYLDER